MYQLVLALILCWLALPVLAQQQLAKARQSSYLTKVFRLTEGQARRLYERGLQAARPDFFTVSVDSFLTDSATTRRVRSRVLPLGYYLVVWSRSKVGRVSVKDSRTFSPFGANEFVGRKSFEALEPFGEVISQ